MSIWFLDKPLARRPGLGAVLALLALVALGVLAMAAGPASAARPRAHAAYAQRCDDPFPATRDRSNPLDLPNAPGPDPLTGANFFVPGPAHGAASSAIAQLVGLNTTNIPSDESWASFQQDLTSGPLSQRISGGQAREVHQLEIIASQPEAQRFSIFSGGGGPGAIFGQVEKILCRNLTADPGSIPIINTYFMHPALGGCSTAREISAESPVFRRQVGEMAQGIARRPAVTLLELDAIGSSVCMAHNGGLPAWEADLRYEINQLAALPHTVVYVEAGYSDANSPGYTAKILNAIGVRKIRGFFTNDTHMNWTIDEIHWAQQVSAKTGGAHFIVNTSQNGNGPKANPHPVTQGNENLCNPPGRALGPLPTTNTGFGHADAFMWTHPPGNSSGCGGGPPSGVFFPAYAAGLAARANQKLGPGFASRPY
ncbi:MAG TPA: glycoside hydrolase family 6 protein [Solirubrobacteraceae bacterium]|jgi:endoglucanase